MYSDNSNEDNGYDDEYYIVSSGHEYEYACESTFVLCVLDRHSSTGVQKSTEIKSTQPSISEQQCLLKG